MTRWRFTIPRFVSGELPGGGKMTRSMTESAAGMCIELHLGNPVPASLLAEFFTVHNTSPDLAVAAQCWVAGLAGG